MDGGRNTLELQIRIAAQDAIRTTEGLRGALASLGAEAGRFTGEGGAAANHTIGQMQRAAERAAASMRLFGADGAEVRRTQAQIKDAALDLIEGGFEPEGEEIRRLIGQYERLGESADGLEEANRSAAESFGGVESAVRATAAGMALLKTASAVGDMASYALEQADAFRGARNEMGVLLGDMRAGAALFERVKAFGDATPFNLDALKQGANILLAAGTPLKDLTDKMRRLGDIAQGDSQRFLSYASSFSKAAAKGRADMEILNAYIDQGAPILTALANQFGATESQIIKMASEGRIQFEEFAATLQSLSAEGGMYYGGMELASRSLAFMQEGLRESVNNLAASYGEMLLPPLSKALEIFTGMVDSINESPIAKGVLVGALAAAAGMLTVMTARVIADTAAQWLNYAAVMARNAAMSVLNPAMIAGIAAAATATAGIIAYAAAQQKAAKAAAEEALAQKEAAGALKEYTSGLSKAEKYERQLMLAQAEREAVQARLAANYHAAQLASTPERVTEVHGEGTASGAITFDYGENPAYRQAKEASEAATNALRSANETLSALRAEMRAITQAETASAYELVDRWQEKIFSAQDALANQRKADIQELEESFRNLALTEENILRKHQGVAAINAYYDKQLASLNKKAASLQKTWREYLANALNVDQRRFATGLDAVALYLEGVDRALETAGMLDNALGAVKPPEAATREQNELLKKQREEIRGVLEALFNIDPALIDKPFTLADASVKALVERYKDLGGAIQDFSKNLSLGADWREKNLSGVEALKNARLKAVNELADKAKSVYGGEYRTQANYMEELFNLQLYYAKEMQKEQKRLQDEERERIRSAHQARMDAYKAEAEYQRELARGVIESGNGSAKDYAQFAAQDAAASVANTDIGGMIAGANPLIAFVKAIVEATLALENVQKTLNFAQTIVKSMFTVIGPLINGSLSEIVDILEEVGAVFGQILSPLIGLFSAALKIASGALKGVLAPLQMVGGAFEGLYNHVIRPFANSVIDIMNAMFGVLNLIPMVNIKKIQRLDAIGELAVELSEQMEKYRAMAQASYERQKDAVNDLLNAQISSLQKQYELGLITRKSYEAQAEAYRGAADEKLYDINVEMKKALESIDSNTYAALSDEQKESAKPYAEQWGGAVPALGHIAGAAVDIVSGIGKAIAGWFGFASGTPCVPEDQPAFIHQGEGIIPKTFNEGIRSGEYALVGKGGGRSGAGASVAVNIAVNGSVVTEQELSDVVYNAISRGVKAGRLSPLPA